MEQKVQNLNLKGQGRLSDGSTVARVLPGETVFFDVKNGPRIIKPSSERVTASCRHYKGCGGCSLMHASDGFVANWKTDVVRTALSAHSIETEILPIMTSPENSRRRAKFSGTRTKKGALVGFHSRASETIVAIPDCKLVSPEMLDAFPVLDELTKLAASRKSEVQITVTTSPSGLDLSVSTEKSISTDLRMTLAELAQTHQIARLSWNNETIVEILTPNQKFGEAWIKVPPGAFLQATNAGEAALVTAVLEIVEGAKNVVDLFAGCGTFSLSLARASEVHAVESESDMLTALDDGWRQAVGLKRISTETRDLFRRPLEVDELSKFEAAVIDPPRAGAVAQISNLANSKIETIAMVSCNPVTFARDAKTLAVAGYRLNWVLPVDQFRWSSHVEMVGSFRLT